MCSRQMRGKFFTSRAIYRVNYYGIFLSQSSLKERNSYHPFGLYADHVKNYEFFHAQSQQ